MSIQYLLVTYPDQRAVLADGAGVGFTNHTLMLPADEYVVTLAGDGYEPPIQDVVLAGTSLVKPLVISFVPVSTTTGADAPLAAAGRVSSRKSKTKNA